MCDSEDMFAGVTVKEEASDYENGHSPGRGFGHGDSAHSDSEDMFVGVKVEAEEFDPGQIVIRDICGRVLDWGRSGGRGLEQGDSTSGRGRGRSRGRGRGTEPTEISDPLSLARLAIKEKRKRASRLQPEDRKRLHEETRAEQLHRVLLPDAPPSKRRRNIPSPERHPCVMAETRPKRKAAEVHQKAGPPARAKSRVVADVNSVPGSSRKLKKESKSAVDVNSVPGPGRKPKINPKSAVGVEDSEINETGTGLIKLLDRMDSDSDLDDNDIDTDGPRHATRDATSEPAVTEDMTLRDQAILIASDKADDAALRGIATTDCFDFRWQNDPTIFTGQKEIFTGPTPGPTFPMTNDTSPVDIFDKMFDNDFLDRLVNETNRYARQTIDKLTALGKITLNSRLHRWTPTDRDEMVSFLAMMILQGLYPLPKEESYFGFNGYGTMPYIRRIMPYNRFLLLKTFLHFVDNDSIEADKKLGRIQPVLDYLNERFTSMYNLSQNIVIDESLLKWYGRLGFSQKIKTKAAQVGVKTYELCESSSGYLWRFFVYTGKSNTNQTEETDQTATETEETATETDLTATETDQTGTETEQTATETVTGTETDQIATGTDQTATETDQIATETVTGTETDQIATGTDQTATETDQIATETDQTGTETEQTATETEQIATGTDQTATETDQTATETEIATEIDQTATGTDQTGTETVTGTEVTATATTASVNTTSPETRPTNATAKIVYQLLEPLLNRGHVLIMDNFYNCPLLARCLKRQKTDCFGTLRLNREFVPDSIKTLTKANMRHGEVVTSYCKDLAVMVWRDANVVSMISTCHSLQVRPHEKNNKLTYKPDLVLDYNKSMGGVDRKDQFLSALPMERDRNKVWYKKLFRRLFNAALFNCFVIYRTRHPRISHRHFRQILAEDLLKRHRQIDLNKEPRIVTHKRVTGDGITTVTSTRRPYHSTTNYGVFVEQNHFPTRSASKRTSCFLCARRKVTSRTVWKCEECDVNLCIEICFKEFHKIKRD